MSYKSNIQKIDVDVASGAVLPPRITTAQRDSIVSPTNGVVIFNTDRNRLEAKTTSSWDAVSSVPVGTILPWIGGYFTGAGNVGFTSVLGNTVASVNSLLNQTGYYVCDGSTLSVSSSPIYDGGGRRLPDLTDSRFLMGSTAGGTIGGQNSTTLAANNLPTHTHPLSGSTVGGSNSDTVNVGASGHTHSSGSLFGATFNDELGVFAQIVAGGLFGPSASSYTSNHYYAQGGGGPATTLIGTNAFAGEQNGLSILGVTGMPSADSTVAGTAHVAAHTHTLSGSATANTTTNSAIENRPVYLSVFYIQRVI